MSTGCSNYYKDIIRIQAFPDEVISFSDEIERFLPSIPVDGVTFSGNLSLGEDDSEIDKLGFDLLIHDMSAVASDQSSDNLPGICHNVKITYNIKNGKDVVDSGEYDEQLRCLMNSNYQLLITYYGGNQSVVRSRKWSFSYSNADDGTTKCTISINNFSGIQRIGQPVAD